MLPIQGSKVVIQRDVTPSEISHEVTVVPKTKEAVGIITQHLEQNRIPHNTMPGGAIKIQGSNSFFGHMLGVESGVSEEGYFSYKGELRVDNAIHPYILAVLGMDTHPVAKPHFRTGELKPSVTKPKSVEPILADLDVSQVTRAYGFPNGATYNGAGQTIAIIELGGGYQESDLNHFWKAARFNPYPTVTAIGVDGAKNSPGSDADGEVALDIEVSGATARAASIDVYFAPNTDAGFYNAIQAAAVNQKTNIMSISWGNAEDAWTGQSIAAMEQALQEAAAKGIIINVAAGDNGSTDGVNDGQYHIDYPGSSAYVYCCGGTTLALTPTGAIGLETVWNDNASGNGATGGGVSTLFPGRNVPDFCGNAGGQSAYMIYVGGQWVSVWGTSAVAPLYSGLFAQLGSAKGTSGASSGLTRKLLLLHAGALFRDIKIGNNSVDPSLPLYSAAVGYDNASGWGSPDGQKFLSLVLAE